MFWRTSWRRIWPAVATAVLLGCGLGEVDQSASLTVFDNFRTIEPGQAYRSAQLDAESLRLVFDQYGVRTIINLRGANEQRAWYQNERAVAQAAGVKLVDVRMSAHDLPSRAALLRLYDAFQTAEYPILIHCQAGADRTSAAAAIWRMVVRGESRATAGREISLLYGYVQQAHPEVARLLAMFQPSREWIEREYPGPRE